MKRKAIALLLSFTMLSLSTTAYAADTVQNAPTINSSGKIIIQDTDITIDSKDLTDLASAFNNNADILSDAQNNIATNSDEYSSSKTYKEGGLCIKDGQIYQCTTDITIAEAWNASHWKRVSISDSINSLYGDMESLKKSVSDGKSAIASAITEKGVSTESDATFDTMASNIGNIQGNPVIVSLGSSSSRCTRTFSATTIPEYSNLTISNFYIQPTGWNVWDDTGSASADYNYNRSMTYNQSTGVLTIPSYTGSGYPDRSSSTSKRYYSFTYNVYCIY